MASIQQSFNQALFSVQGAIARTKIAKAAKTYSEKTFEEAEEARKIKEAQAEQDARESAARAKGFSSAQAEYDTQEAARHAAEELKKKDPSFGFITPEGPHGSAFGDPDPADRFVIGKLQDNEWEQSAFESSFTRAKELLAQQKGLQERINYLKGGVS